MDADLSGIVAALADIGDVELRLLVTTLCVALYIAPGFFTWLDRAADWEWNRRAGVDLPLQPPQAAIPPQEDGLSIAVAIVLRQQFANDVPKVAALFDAIVGTLTDTEARH